MPIIGSGFEIHIVRRRVQTRNVGITRERTIGDYEVFARGAAINRLSGTIAEQKGPSDNSRDGDTFDRRIEPGRYPLFTRTAPSTRPSATTDPTKPRTISAKNPGPGSS